jgi:hypothetical protein
MWKVAFVAEIKSVTNIFLKGLSNTTKSEISLPRLRFEPGIPEYVGRDSVVGIATRYGLDGPGIESRWR